METVPKARPTDGHDVLHLRPTSPEDITDLFEQQRDPEYVAMAAFTSPNPSDRDAFDRHLRKVLADGENVLRTITVDGAVVGSAGSYVMFGERQVCYGIGRAHWGRGYATRALAVLLAELPHRPLFARVVADNVGSIRVLERCGFRPVGRERGFAEGRGADVDEIVFRLDAEGATPSLSES